ncbi:hypothetical protein [Leptothoe sp. PORK10 BA2]|uniref:hypothetical protein n=1 Tax=Leptothoe sp. PORK10 BA2 TaxID=3110254 RepID=UPI002B1F7E22|nr:hypothetical protein [Leptothoe sp. PORK10 BA2]MEA5465821.1 hypothetical protein [Leptothoe sp. PORK10 BA2]
MARILKNPLTSITGLGLALGLAAVPALAQSTGGFDDLSGEADNNEVFNGSGLSLTDLMSNARRANGLSSDEFSRKTDRNIDQATADFHRRQQAILEPGTEAAVETPELEQQL